MALSVSASALRAARIRAGLSRELVAVAIHRSHYTVVKYENGANQPSAQVLVRLSELYRCPIEDFLGSDDDSAVVA